MLDSLAVVDICVSSQQLGLYIDSKEFHTTAQNTSGMQNLVGGLCLTDLVSNRWEFFFRRCAWTLDILLFLPVCASSGAY